jgi:caa(3)-type oxidase subunit IV
MQREHEHKGGNKATFNLIFGLLVIITILEIAVSEMGGLIGHALLIGLTTAKGGFVVAYYMHLKYDPPILTWIFVVPIIMAAAMVISLQGLAGYDLVR